MLHIIHQDADLIAINKPSGLLSVPGKIAQASLQELVVERYPNARVIHRLDMQTSGIILFALNYEAQKHLSKQFESRCVKKAYIAVTEGLVEASEGEISAPLICDWPNRPKQIVDWRNGKQAITQFKVLSRDGQQHTTRLKLIPITGRSHQLRVHMQHIGHAILGDRFYADNRAQNKASRLLLHARNISFTHPASQKPMHLVCEEEF